jgi:cystathionine beta-lyase
MPGHKHIPTQSVSPDARDRTLAFYAPTKTFSLAGLRGAYHIVYNRYLRERLERQSSQSGYNACCVLSMHALIGGYSTEGEEWVDQMIRVVKGNIDYACDFIEKNFPGVRVMRPQGTYMLFLDCHDFCAEKGIRIDELQLRGVHAGVIWHNGEDFVMPETIRMNLALPFSRLKEALNRLKDYAFV